MADKTLPEAGVGIGTGVTTTLIAFLTNCSEFLPEQYRHGYTQVIPYLCPVISWALVWCYNRFVEPPEMASIKGKLKRDLKMLKKCLKNKSMSKAAKDKAQLDYDETSLKYASLGRDFAAGLYSKPTQ